jgi:hypothetical protein
MRLAVKIGPIIYCEVYGKGPALLLNAATAWHGEAWRSHGDHLPSARHGSLHYRANKAICDKFIDVRMSNLLPLKNFLGYVIHRQP